MEDSPLLKHFLLRLVLLAISLNHQAQGLFDKSLPVSSDESAKISPDVIHGYARGSAWGGAKDYNYSCLFGELALQAGMSRGKTIFSGDVRFYEGSFYNERRTIIQLKEAYAGYIGNKLDILIGNQIVSWGRTDGFNPVNNINPNDYFFLTPDPDDQRIANFMLRSRYRFSPQTELETIIIPVYRPSVYRYELFDMGEDISFEEAVLPAAGFENTSLAARLNMEFPAIGFSFSWFHGIDPFYGFRLIGYDLRPSQRIIYQSDFYTKDAIGADFALPINKWIFRSEMALNLTTGYRDYMHIPDPEIYYVAGVERDISGFLTIVQYVSKRSLDFTPLTTPVLSNPLDPISQAEYAGEMIRYESALFNRKIFNQQEKTNHAFMFSINRSFAYNVLATEFSCYYNITSEEYLIRSKIIWDMSDGVSISSGFSLMQGPENSVFSKAGKVLNGIFTGIKVSF